MEKIIPAFKTTLFDPVLSDAVVDMTELGIDSFLDEGVFKNIPIVSVLIGLSKTAQNIHDRNLLKQTIKFINTFNNNTIDKKNLEKHKDKLNKNPKFAESELERVIILLNSNIDLKKSELLAHFYSAYVNEEINWHQFCELADVTSRVFITDLKILHAVFKKEIKDTTQCEIYKIDRLIALGLLNATNKSMRISSNHNSETERYIQTGVLGNIYCQIAFNEN